MNILMYLNVSNISDINSDSGFIFQKLLINEILKKRPSWNIYFLCPKNTPIINKRVRHIHLVKGLTKYGVRFDFDWESFEKLFRSSLADLDVIYINQPEQAENFFALITTIMQNKPSTEHGLTVLSLCPQDQWSKIVYLHCH